MDLIVESLCRGREENQNRLFGGFGVALEGWRSFQDGDHRDDLQNMFYD